MRLITRKILAAEAAQKWQRQYRHIRTSVWMQVNGDSEETHRQLEALGPEPDPDAVDAAIGNQSWTRVRDCDECERSNLPLLVEVGEELDMESSTADICLDCLRKAVALAEGQS